MAGHNPIENQPFQTIRAVLERTLARVGLDRRLEDYRIFEGWDDVVGETIARNAQPSRLDDKRLVVVVRSSAWLQELGMLRRDLCKRLNEWMGREVIGEIFFVVGKLDSAPRPASTNASVHGAASLPTAEDAAKRPPSPRTHDAGDRGGANRAATVTQNADTDIAAAFERLWQAHKRNS